MTEQALSVLAEFRNEIDAMDSQIIETLSRRFDLIRKVARLKKEHCIPMMQQGRVDGVKNRCTKLGIEKGLDPTLVNDIYSLIIGQSCQVETKIIEGRSD
jgi:chorismate mutase-like protein